MSRNPLNDLPYTGSDPTLMDDCSDPEPTREDIDRARLMLPWHASAQDVYDLALELAWQESAMSAQRDIDAEEHAVEHYLDELERSVWR